MTLYYTTTSEVATLIGRESDFSSTSVPTATQVESMIAEAEDEIDGQTGHAWREKTITKESHDVPRYFTAGSGYKIFLFHRAVKTMATASGDKIEIWDGSEWTDWVVDYDEGRDKDFWLEYESGILYLMSSPTYRSSAVRVTYRYGETTVPNDIKKCATMLTAIKLCMGADRNAVTSDAGNSSAYLSMKDKVDTWQKQADRVIAHNTEIPIMRK